MENRLGDYCTLYEYVLTAFGYCPEPRNIQEERIYHAFFLPNFHRDCFLSLHIFPGNTDAILTFGYFPLE